MTILHRGFRNACIGPPLSPAPHRFDASSARATLSPLPIGATHGTRTHALEMMVTVSDRLRFGAFALLVVGLGLLAWAFSPNAVSRGSILAPEDADSAARGDDAVLPRAKSADIELALLSDKDEVEIAQLASPETVIKLLGSRYCGTACELVKQHVRNHELFDIDVTKSEDYILPPPESYSTIAPGLTPFERASIARRSMTVVVRSHGSVTIDQLPARAAFAVTAAIADALSALVYDEVTRRIESASTFAKHVITVPPGENVFVPEHIAIQIYRQDDGTARLLTLGMARFGSPDFSIRGAKMELGAALATVMNVVARRAAGADTSLTPISLPEVARMAQQTMEGMTRDPKASVALELDALPTARTAGDPENTMLELVPRAGPAGSSWTTALSALLGEASPP